MTARRFVLVTSVFVLGALAVLRAADVSGKWTSTFATDIGEQIYTFDFVVKGTVLTGVAKGNMTGESKISDGKVDGDKISFVENVDFQGMPLKITYTGQMTSADEIKMTRNVADLAMESLVAKRVK
jgi:hypothetical protein